ncbi:enteropeptidase-like [Zerene cesonia]|uniref:enteropeptidase-like n=1 Tax=Zerene cesonia TaxID=33412 RepID=UPI0018E588BB|nr:enteropeptidase-like [Zerene cesonia]
MQVLAVLLVGLLSVAYANIDPLSNTAYGYLTRFGIPEAERIRKAEDAAIASRIVGGLPAALGQYPYQAGLISDIVGINGNGVCGGSLISANRVLTAAHCWFDGQNQAWRFTVVLGSVYLFHGGTRLQTSVVQTHPSWFPLLVRNDIAVIYLPEAVQFSANIAPVALPSNAELQENFAGEQGIASGFGITADGGGISTNQFLSHVRLNIISNSVCQLAFPLVLTDSNICTSGLGGTSTCRGDSGGPLVVDRSNGPVLVGLITEIINTTDKAVCGGSLISANRVLTAAHCWYDGEHQAWRFTIVLGSIYLFKGGTRMQSSAIQVHPLWSPYLIRNDIAVIFLPETLQFSDTISPIALPAEDETDEKYAGLSAIATGFGLTFDGENVTESQSLNQVRMNIMTNFVCSLAYPFLIRDSNICTNSLGGASTCRGDSGGPLVVDTNNGRVLIGITSFGSAFGCEFGLPAVFTKVSSFLDFIRVNTL